MVVKSGSWVLWEKEYDKLTISGPSRAAMKKPAPVIEYLKAEGRCRNVDDETAARIQAQVDKNLKKVAAEAAYSEENA